MEQTFEEILMATLYWQGSGVTNGATRFDFNYGPNWRIQRNNTSYLSWPLSMTAPQAGDSIVVGNGGIAAESPLLFGGYSGGISAGSWNRGSATGTPFNTSLISASISLNTSKYPFPYFGGGITGEIQNYLVNTLGFDSSLIAGESAGVISKGLVLKIDYTTTITTTGRINESQDVGAFENYTKADINFVPSFGASPNPNAVGSGSLTAPASCRSSLLVFGGNMGTLGGIGLGGADSAPTNGCGNLNINNGAFQAVRIWYGSTGTSNIQTVSRRPHRIYFNGITAGSVNTVNGDINVDKNSVIGVFKVNTGANPYYLTARESGYDGREITLAGKFDTKIANDYLGWSTSTTASPFVSGVLLYDQFTHAPDDPQFDYEPTILVGMPEDGVTFVAQNFHVFTEVGPYNQIKNGNAQRPWNIEFFGDSNITSMSVEGTKIRANKILNENKTISITTLSMAENSNIDFTYAPQVDKWYFGSLTGNTVVGGLNFLDSTCTIKADAGVRLYNTQVVNNFDQRAATQVPISFEVYEPFEGGGKGLGGWGG